MTEIKDIKLIELYRSGSLSVQETEAFENRLLVDASFNELYNDFYEADDLLKFKELWDVKGELDKLDYADESNNWNKYLYGFVALAVLSGGVLTYVFQDSQKDNKNINKLVLTKESVKAPTELKNTVESLESRIIINRPERNKISANEILTSPIQEELKVVSQVETAYEPKIIKEEIKSFDLVKSCVGSPKVDYVIDPACNGDANGRILVKKVTGEYSPYSILNDKEKLENKGSFDDLKKGLYEIIVVDNRACETKISVEIKSMDCSSLNKEDASQLSDYKIYLPHQSWKVPTNRSHGRVEIQDQSGGLVFVREFEKGVNDEWDGLSNQGKEVIPGVYYYKVKNENDGTEKVGTITVIK